MEMKKQESLILAIKEADVESVKSILVGLTQADFDDRYKPAEKANFICAAIKKDEEQIVELLLERVDRKVAYEGCELALIDALETENEEKEVLEVLLKAATSIKIFSEPIFDIATLSEALELAIFKRKDQLVEVLLNHGAKLLKEGIKSQNIRGKKFLEMLQNARKAVTLEFVYNSGSSRVLKIDSPRKHFENELISLAILFGGPKISQLVLYNGAAVHRFSLYELGIPYSSSLSNVRLLSCHDPSFVKVSKLNSLNLQELKKTHQMLVAHKAFGAARGKKRSDDEFWFRFGNEPSICKFKQACEEEINLMKEEKIDNTTVTLFEICTNNNLNRLAAYAMNDIIIDYLKSEEFEKKFPIYHGKMRWELKKGFKRNFLLRRVCNFFNTLSVTRKDEKLCQLPATCTGNIFEFLSNQDLINLRDSYY